ncbi:hypothetical protein V6N11_018397 [Hibiscus sabdariffa]|uniref:Uncharacterized protein n=1 Tax=Hibiscus sabdariffa TaxID=183260 RepID=A0ABR2T7W1_9ROSI
MLLLLLCRCFNVLPKQDDKGDASSRDNGSCLSRNLGWDSDLGRASSYVIGLSLKTCTPSSLLRAWALGLVFEWSRPPLDALLILGYSGEYSNENKIPFQIPPFCPGRKSQLVICFNIFWVFMVKVASVQLPLLNPAASFICLASSIALTNLASMLLVIKLQGRFLKEVHHMALCVRFSKYMIF